MFQVTGGKTRNAGSRERNTKRWKPGGRNTKRWKPGRNTKRWKPGAKHEMLEAGSETGNAGSREQNTKRWKPGAKQETLEAGSGNAEIALMGHYSCLCVLKASTVCVP